MSFTSFLAFTKKIEGAYDALCRPLYQRYGLARTSFDILMFLHNNPDCCTAKQISTMRNLKANVVSQHVDRLVNDGYLLRQGIEGDRRKIRLVCTEKARAVCADGSALQRQFYMGLVQNLTQDDLNGFKRCFQVIACNADTLRASGPIGTEES